MKFKYLATAMAVVASASAAGAADLNKPAKVAVDYVKVCDAYGTGFFYIPGSDTCLRVGGYIYGGFESGTAWTIETPSNSFGTTSTSLAQNQHGYNAMDSYSRADIRLDARTKTEYGVLRSFIDVHADYNSSSATSLANGAPTFIRFDNGFVQFAGITAGRQYSNYQFLAPVGIQDQYGSVMSQGSTNMLAYTYSFGNGISATLSLEDPTTYDYATSLLPQGAAGGPAIALANGYLNNANARRSGQTFIYGGLNAPDVVGNIIVAQAWGTAMFAAVAHQVYGTGLGSAAAYTTGASLAPTAAGNTGVSKWGYGLEGAVRLNAPMLGSIPGVVDFVELIGTYANGATGYSDWNPATNGVANKFQNATGTTTLLSYTDLGADATYSAATGLKLTRSWSVFGAWEHNFNEKLSFDVLGGLLGEDGYAQAGTANNAGKYAAVNPGYGGNDFSQYEFAFDLNWKPAGTPVNKAGAPIIPVTITPYVEGKYVAFNSATKANYAGSNLASGGSYVYGLRVRRDF